MEQLIDAAERAAAGAAEEPFEPTIGRPGACSVNVPALIALCQAYLAQFRGDAEATAVLASRVMAERGEGSLLGSVAQGYLAVAEWLRGRLAAAERAFVSGIAGSGGRPATWKAHGEAISSARFSVPRAGWTRPC